MTRPLHVETFGSGPDLVLLHGWGMHGGVWGDFARRLAESYQVHVVDLPGYGFSTDFPTPSPPGGQIGRTANLHGEAARRVLDRECPACTLGGGRSKWVSTTLLESPPPVLPRGGRDAITGMSVFPAARTPLKKRRDGEDKTFLEHMFSTLLENAPPRALWLGWSLGGTLAALLAAEYPERVSGLILLACNPCFVRRPDWSWGMEEAVFDGFAAGVRKDAAGALPRFAGLLCQGLEEPRPVLKNLREGLASRPPPLAEALLTGLDWLRRLDARRALASLACPLMAVGGDRDALVPAAVLEASVALHPRGRYTVIPGASHVPFLSHREAVLAAVASFAGVVE